METTTYTCEIDTDEFRECETCERTSLVDDGHACDHSGTFACEDCYNAEMDYLMRSVPASALHPTDAQIRADHDDVAAWCGYDSDEYLGSLTVVNSL